MLFVAVVGGGVLLVRRERALGAVWAALFALPLALAALAGLAAPVLLDRTLTLTAWAPLLAIAMLLDWLLRRERVVGVLAIVALAMLLVPPTITAVSQSSGPDRALRRLEAVACPGDVVAVRSALKAPEVQWTLGVRGHVPWRPVMVAGVTPQVAGLALGGAPPTGRVWVLDWSSRVREADGYTRCAPDQNFGVSRIMCLRRDGTGPTTAAAPGAVAGDELALGATLPHGRPPHVAVTPRSYRPPVGYRGKVEEQERARALYAGEGAETDDAVMFANPDERMVRFFCGWFRRYFDVDESRLRVRVYLHEG